MTAPGDWHLAQINIARLSAPRGDPRVADFFSALERINALAEAAPGFVWRLKDEADDAPAGSMGDATGIRATPDPLLILNLSVWRDADALFAFVYRSAHTPVMARRRDWFDRPSTAYQALWWVPAGARPTVNDGLSRLWLLDRFGPSPQAFTFKARFPMPDEAGTPIDMKPEPWCVAGRDAANG